jgi:hypothetical protein
LISSYAKEDLEMQSRRDDVFENAQEAPPRLLHVLNGDCTAEGPRLSGVPGTLAVWADVLHEGPVPPDDDFESWFQIRTRFHDSTGSVSNERADMIYRNWQRQIDGFREFDEVVLWFSGRTRRPRGTGGLAPHFGNRSLDRRCAPQRLGPALALGSHPPSPRPRLKR